MPENEPIIWINGELLPAGQARISPLDRGFTVGCGAFETLRACNGIPFAVTRHWKRLVNSCKILGIRPPIRDEFIESMKQTLRANGLSVARVRFTVTAGEAPETGAGSLPNCVVHAVPLQRQTSTVKIVTVDWLRNERSAIAGVKCSSYADNMIALVAAHAGGAGEVAFANTRGELCEGATTNIFLVRNGRAITPPLASGCLPGITRGLVLEFCRNNGVQVEEKKLSYTALKNAEEAFLTSSIRGVQPISHVDGRKLPHAPGPATRRIAALYQKLVRQHDDP